MVSRNLVLVQQKSVPRPKPGARDTPVQTVLYCTPCRTRRHTPLHTFTSSSFTSAYPVTLGVTRQTNLGAFHTHGHAYDL